MVLATFCGIVRILPLTGRNGTGDVLAGRNKEGRLHLCYFYLP